MWYNTGMDNEIGTGDPTFPGGIGCQHCPTLWATASDLEDHLRRVYWTLRREGRFDEAEALFALGLEPDEEDHGLEV